MATLPTINPNANPNESTYQPADPSSEPVVQPIDPASTQAVQDPETGEWFLEAPSGTRYRTADDAIAGITEKDRTIARLQAERSTFQQLLTGQSQQQAPAEPSWYELMEADLAATQGGKPNPNSFQKAVQASIRSEAQKLAQDMLGQLSPLVQYAGLNRAVEIASSEPKGDPNLPAFVKSPAFREVMKEWPTLGRAIQEGQRNPVYAEQQLPEILRIAYMLARAKAGAPAVAPAPAPRPAPSTPGPTWWTSRARSFPPMH